MHPNSLKIQWYQTCDRRCHGLGNFDMTNVFQKENVLFNNITIIENNFFNENYSILSFVTIIKLLIYIDIY